MSQSLTQLPKTAEIKIRSHEIPIKNHRVVRVDGLLGGISYIIRDPSSPCETLSEFEKQGISFEMVIEECSRELEYDPMILVEFCDKNYNVTLESGTVVQEEWTRLVSFSKSSAGRAVADQFIEKIRSCDNWKELYDELERGSKFMDNMEERVQKEVKKLCPKA